MNDFVAPNYTVLLQWSPVDDAFIATIPELPGAHTHGDSYEEALKNAREVIELVVSELAEEGQPIPPALTFRIEEPIEFPKLESGNVVRRAS